jgi:Flp pilus assembly pilin Flp
MFQIFKRLAVEDSGMEMLEWAIVAVLFAVAASAAFGTFATSLSTEIGSIKDVVGGNGAGQ